MYRKLSIGEEAVAEYWDAYHRIMPTILRESEGVYSCVGPSPNRETWVLRKGWSAREAFNAWRERVAVVDRDAARPEERRGASLLPELRASLERYGEAEGGEYNAVYRVLGGTIKRREWAKGVEQCKRMLKDQFCNRVHSADGMDEVQLMCWLFQEAVDYGAGDITDFYGAVYDVLVREIGADPDGRDEYIAANSGENSGRQEYRVACLPTSLADVLLGLGWKVWYCSYNESPFTVIYYYDRGSRATEATRLRTDAALATLYASWRGPKPGCPLRSIARHVAPSESVQSTGA